MFLIKKSNVVYYIAGIVSLLLSLCAGLSFDVVNPDAICYLSSAAAMQHGLHYGMHLCPQAQWPFYSAIIFLASKISYLNITVSAYLVNAIFSLISVLVFIKIVKNLNDNPRLLWLAAFVILLAHEFNALRQDVIRDHGFIAFYLLSILFLIKYFRVYQWRYAFSWSLSLVVAVLFRIEAVVFLFFLPFLVWVGGSLQFSLRLKRFIQLHLTTIILSFLLAIFLLIHPSQNLSRLNELPYQFSHAWEIMQQNFQLRADSLAKYVLVSDSARDAHLVFGVTLLSWYLVEVIKVLTPVYSLLLLYAWYKGLLREIKVRKVLWGYVIVNIIITLVFLAEHLFLSKRYLMALSLVLMLWVPFVLNLLIIQLKNKKWLLTLVFVVIVISSLGGIVRFGYSKAYIREAGLWLSIHVPPDAKLYSNDYQLMYYSHHFGDDLFQKVEVYSKLNLSQDWKQFDYLAIRDDKVVIPLKPVVEFSNKRGDNIKIYKKGMLK